MLQLRRFLYKPASEQHCKQLLAWTNFKNWLVNYAPQAPMSATRLSFSLLSASACDLTCGRAKAESTSWDTMRRIFRSAASVLATLTGLPAAWELLLMARYRSYTCRLRIHYIHAIILLEEFVPIALLVLTGLTLHPFTTSLARFSGVLQWTAIAVSTPCV